MENTYSFRRIVTLCLGKFATQILASVSKLLLFFLRSFNNIIISIIVDSSETNLAPMNKRASSMQTKMPTNTKHPKSSYNVP